MRAMVTRYQVSFNWYTTCELWLQYIYVSFNWHTTCELWLQVIRLASIDTPHVRCDYEDHIVDKIQDLI